MNNQLKEIIKQAIDIHVHIGPEIIPRKYTVEQLINEERDKIRGFVLKNHFYPTTAFIKEAQDKYGLRLYGSIALNNAVGGLNSESIFAANYISDLPLVVWLPTINANNFLLQSEFEIAPEWVKNKNFDARKGKDVAAVTVIKNGKITEQTLKTLQAIKHCNAVLATGHISWQESVKIIAEAQRVGIKKIVITHPIYQYINMPIAVQIDLAGKGCFLEQSYSMYSIDNIAIKAIAKQVKTVGSQSVILSSDVGQTFSPSPSEALYAFVKLLKKEGISEDQLFTMLVENPNRLLSID